MPRDDMEAPFDAAIKSGKINGAIICATDAQGHFTYTKTIGERTLLSGEKKSHQLDDVVYLASATKLLASIAALTCVEDGLISLTDDVSDIMPELGSKQVLTGFSKQNEPLLEPQHQPITLEMLLTHSSGLTYYFIDPKIGKWKEQNVPPPQDPSSIPRKTVEDLITYPLGFQPGESWMYGTGLDWAGRIVERLTNKTLLEHLQHRVFSRLAITSAQFYPVTRPDLRSCLVDLNPNDPEGLGKAVTGGAGDMNRVTKGDFGGHGLFMTVPDYLKVLHSILTNDHKILSPSTVESMFTNHLTPSLTSSLFQACEIPGLGAAFRVGTAPGSKVGYGLGGLLTMEDAEGWYGENTLTWGGGQTFAWFIDRKNDLCAVCAIQSALPVDMQLVAELKQVFRKGIYKVREERKGKGS